VGWKRGRPQGGAGDSPRIIDGIQKTTQAAIFGRPRSFFGQDRDILSEDRAILSEDRATLAEDRVSLS
jgi:hypothetical protein